MTFNYLASRAAIASELIQKVYNYVRCKKINITEEDAMDQFNIKTVVGPENYKSCRSASSGSVRFNLI